ncbi:MAG: TonB family protein [Moraxella sp.]|uniref:energy transducer TonB n=1 Tax=Moraxella sp. TaxID=479 RepID=UPI0026DC1BFF|nr:TonB family protein [Moraxella sp.]MDO4449767.1 TonB family protein [Moraxella sp.]
MPSLPKDGFLQNLQNALDNKNLDMPMATVIAVAVHAFVIFGIGFSAGVVPDEMAQEVASVLEQNKEKNEDARFVANASQEGGGEVRQQLRQETTMISPDSSDEMEDTQDIINLEKQTRQQAYQESYLRTTLSIRYTDSQNDNDAEKKQNDLDVQEERIRKKIRTLEAQLSQKQQVFASKTNIHTVNSNATTHGVAAGYLENFRRHVERIANQYYPDEARRNNIMGDVRLMVSISPDGHVKSIRLLESSGSAVLDEAAKQSVRQSAPYGHFDEEMGGLSELRIIRTWRYSDKIEVTN